MKVVVFNGSPKAEGNTFQALKMVTDEIEKEGIEVEIIQVGDKLIYGCKACNTCVKTKDGKCILKDDVNTWIEKMVEADGILLGTPVHYSNMAGAMKAFLDRAFYVSSVNKSLFRHKVGASIAAVRRSGGIPAVDQLNHYFSYAEMFIATSSYWNVIHGAAPGQVKEDEEGVQIMRTLGKNMAWLVKAIDAQKKENSLPEFERKIFTNFVR